MHTSDKGSLIGVAAVVGVVIFVSLGLAGHFDSQGNFFLAILSTISGGVLVVCSLLFVFCIWRERDEGDFQVAALSLIIGLVALIILVVLLVKAIRA